MFNFIGFSIVKIYNYTLMSIVFDTLCIMVAKLFLYYYIIIILTCNITDASSRKGHASPSEHLPDVTLGFSVAVHIVNVLVFCVTSLQLCVRYNVYKEHFWSMCSHSGHVLGCWRIWTVLLLTLRIFLRQFISLVWFRIRI